MLWHGAWDQPSGLKTDWVTATPPPAVTTLSASHVPEESVGIAGATAPSAGTATSVCPVAPVSVTAVTAAVTARAVVLVSTSEPGATPPAVDWPVQYQADDSASGRADERARRGCGGDRCRRALQAHGDGDSGDDEHHESDHAPPALAADVGRGHNSTVSTGAAVSATAAGSDGGDDARLRRERPMSAAARNTQAASSTSTTNGTSGNCESASVAGPLALTAYCAAHPNAGCRAAV